MACRELAAPFLDGGPGLLSARGAGLAAVLTAGAVAAAVLHRGREIRGSVRTPRVVAAGLGFLVLGALPFAVAPALRDDPRRAHLLASVGAAVAVAAAVGAIRRTPLRTAAAVALVVLAAGAGAARCADVTACAGRVGGLVRALAEGAPSPPPGTVLLLLDGDGPPPREDVLGLTITDVHLADALRLVNRQADLSVFVFGRALRFRWNGTPEARAEGLAVRLGDGTAAAVPWERVALFREDSSGRTTRIDAFPEGAVPFDPPKDLGRLVPRAGPRPARLESLCPPLSDSPSRAPSRPPAGADGPA
jgi:hypothetical protein